MGGDVGVPVGHSRGRGQEAQDVLRSWRQAVGGPGLVPDDGHVGVADSRLAEDLVLHLGQHGGRERAPPRGQQQLDLGDAVFDLDGAHQAHVHYRDALFPAAGVVDSGQRVACPPRQLGHIAIVSRGSAVRQAVGSAGHLARQSSRLVEQYASPIASVPARISIAAWAGRYCSSSPQPATPAGMPRPIRVINAATARPRCSGGACLITRMSTSTRIAGTPSMTVNSSPATHHGPNGTASSARTSTSSVHRPSISTPGRSRCSTLTRGAPASPPAAPRPRASPIAGEDTAWWRRITMMTSSSPAPIVFTNMISRVAARSTGCPQSVRMPASMPPVAAAAGSLGGRPAGLVCVLSSRPPGMTLISTAPASAIRNPTAVKTNGSACASACTPYSAPPMAGPASAAPFILTSSWVSA